MFHRAVSVLVVAAITAAPVAAADPVPVPGTTATYAPTVEVPVGDKSVRLALTGAGLRSKSFVKVYTVASYVQEGAAVRSAADVLKADSVRMLHLVMQRGVEPAEFLGAFKDAVAKSNPKDAFADEFTQLAKAVGDRAAEKGDHVFLLSIPGEGVRFRLADKIDVIVKNPAFAQALWEVYLGSKPVAEGLKDDLVKRLK